MSIFFLGSEDTALLHSESTSYTNGSSVRSANSRLGMVLDTNEFTTAVLNDAKTSVAIHWWVDPNSIWDDEGSQICLRAVDTVGTPFFRVLVGTNGGTLVGQYWNGSSWVTSGVAGSISNSGASEVVVLLSLTAYTIYKAGSLVTSGSFTVSSTDIKKLEFWCPDGGLTQNPLVVSEIMIGDQSTTYIGSVVETEIPTSDGSDTDGTGSYTDIDENEFSGSDVIELTTSGNRRSFKSPARTSTLHRVFGVGVAVRLKCDVTGPTQVKLYLTVSGTRYYSPVFTLTTGYLPYYYVWDTNPATGVQWLTSAANDANLEWGVEVQ